MNFGFENIKIRLTERDVRPMGPPSLGQLIDDAFAFVGDDLIRDLYLNVNKEPAVRGLAAWLPPEGVVRKFNSYQEPKLAMADRDEVRLIENPSKRSTQSRRHRAFFVGTDIAFSDEKRITQPKELFEFCSENKIIHWSKGEGATPDDIRRFVGTIHVWERW